LRRLAARAPKEAPTRVSVVADMASKVPPGSTPVDSL
jgi:hypothetical protein